MLLDERRAAEFTETNKVDLLKQRGYMQEFQLKIHFINPPSLIILTFTLFPLSKARLSFLFFSFSQLCLTATVYFNLIDLCYDRSPKRQ